MKALILAGSDVTVTERLQSLCRDAALVVAADSGVRHARVLGVTPDLIVGDFDSATREDLEPYKNVPKEVHPARKDRLDLELALNVARARGATEFLIVGALGGRLDQTLAALFIASRLHEQYFVTLHSGHLEAYPLRSSETLTLTLPEGTTFSVLGLAPVSVLSLAGASYPLDRAELPFGVGLGVSNRATAAPLTATLHEGAALLLTDFSSDLGPTGKT